MNQIPDTVAKTLDELSRRFGATGAVLWSQYVHYIQAYAIGCLVGGSIVGIGLLLVARICFAKAATDKYSEPEWNVCGFACLTFGLIVLAIFTAANLADICSPQGAAIYHLVAH